MFPANLLGVGERRTGREMGRGQSEETLKRGGCDYKGGDAR